MTGRGPAHLLVKPAGPDCNLDCGYCFYASTAAQFPGSRAHRMSDEVLRHTMRRFLSEGGDALAITWQGGEPTLMGLPFYQRAVELQQQYGRGQTISNALQTNGVLLDRAWLGFLSRYRFLVGLSIDGPAHVHDRYRVDHGRKGTHATVEARARALLDAGVSVNALTVVTDHAVEHAAEIYRYLVDLGFEWLQFIPDGSSPHAVAPERYAVFLTTVFDLWKADFVEGRPTTTVRAFESLASVRAGRQPFDCTMLDTCGNYLVVEHDGGIYACDFYVEPQWRLGNVASASLAALLGGDRQRAFGARKAARSEDCAHCPWLSSCHGGCPKDRGPDDKTRYCAATRAFLAHADAPLNRLVRRLRVVG